MTETNRDGVIESAMSRIAQPAASDGAAAQHTTRTSVGRREYDQALAHRLEQIRNAMGESGQVAPTTPTAKPVPSATANMYAVRPRTLIITALASALLGVGLTWHAMRSNVAAQLFPPPPGTALSTPATPPPAVAGTVATLPPPQETDEEQVRKVLEGWRMAWSRRDVETYLSYYSPDFVPPKGQKRPEWAAERRKNLSSRPQISINVHDLEIEHLAANRISLTFLQDYAAGNYRENKQAKTLSLVRQKSSWLIVGEKQGADLTPAAPN